MTETFLSFEGIDGSGKSTQAARLVETLRGAGRRVVAVREPGSTPIAERVRELLLDRSVGTVEPRAELLLYVACRAQLVDEVIRPALARGEAVVSDRFADSSVAYQGYGRELGADLVRQANLVATGGLEPAVTVLLDVPVEVGRARVGRTWDRLEAEARDFHERVRNGFLAIARQQSDRFIVVDGTPEPDTIAASILDELRLRAPILFRGGPHV